MDIIRKEYSSKTEMYACMYRNCASEFMKNYY